MAHTIWFAFAVISFFFIGLLPSASAADRVTIGYVENILLYPGDLHLKAKIDTGAKTSSIDVRDPVAFEREGREWVRFKIKSKTGESGFIERPVLRKTNIRRAKTEKEARYVISLGICLGGYFKEAEVNLNNRAGMGYRLLIGRLYLGDQFLIDSSKKNLTKPNCPEAPQR